MEHESFRKKLFSSCTDALSGAFSQARGPLWTCFESAITACITGMLEERLKEVHLTVNSAFSFFVLTPLPNFRTKRN